jgi:hypothetical protein
MVGDGNRIEAFSECFLNSDIWPDFAVGKYGVHVEVALDGFVAENVGKINFSSCVGVYLRRK